MYCRIGVRLDIYGDSIDDVYIHPKDKNYFLTITCEKKVKIIGERRGSH
jgi:hypothetical protein